MRFRRTLFASLLAFSFLACKKNLPEQTAEQKALQEDTYAATAILSVEGMLNEIEFIAKQAPLINQEGSFLTCATITRQQVSAGQKVDVIFNPNTICSDNTYRAGKLSLMCYSNGDIAVTPSGYSVANTIISGVFYFSNVNENQKNYLALSVNDGKFTASNGAYIKFDVERRSNISSGASTSDISDDVIEIDNATYDLDVFNLATSTLISAQTKNPYTLKYSCTDKFRPRAGIILFQRAAQNKRMIELGSGNCSDVPTLSDVVK